LGLLLYDGWRLFDGVRTELAFFVDIIVGRVVVIALAVVLFGIAFLLKSFQLAELLLFAQLALHLDLQLRLRRLALLAFLVVRVDGQFADI